MVHHVCLWFHDDCRQDVYSRDYPEADVGFDIADVLDDYGNRRRDVSGRLVVMSTCREDSGRSIPSDSDCRCSRYATEVGCHD